jgi:hypothetical protein
MYVDQSLLPIIYFPVLSHVGTLNPIHKRPWSLEGDSLSVTTHPEAWRAIARLGDAPTWLLTRDLNSLLDAHALSDSQRTHITDWAIAKEYVTYQNSFRVTYYDSELDRECYYFEDSPHDAEVAAQNGNEVTPDILLVSTDSFPHKRGRDNAKELILSLYVESETSLDGVWFSDTDDVAALSAPRGLITLSALPNWTAVTTPTKPTPHLHHLISA